MGQAHVAHSESPNLFRCQLLNPAMLTEAVFLFDATAGDPGSDAALAQMLPASREVVSLVRMVLGGAAPRPAIESGSARYGVNERLTRHRVVTIGTEAYQRQWHATPVYDEMALAAELAAIR
ncbi:hypothetical protein PHO31112_04415 [Pandoraea horticolens]|uniref:Uncharacterized protein n=1 Tax=Pandoraea horticolens TaxID=2508298 RepID=A0A5E4YB70_9BURK|nr:hypothetical protein PHO31112_04415 [Pandoraea horticolens]